MRKVKTGRDSLKIKSGAKFAANVFDDFRSKNGKILLLLYDNVLHIVEFIRQKFTI